MWLFSGWYVKSFAGLIECYAMGLPFLASLFYFVWFSEDVFSRFLYGITKVFTLCGTFSRLPSASVSGLPK